MGNKTSIVGEYGVEPLVSIILTSYNKPLFVGKAIESILAQTETSWELFIMDDNSNVETVEIIKKFLGDKRIHYFNSFIEDIDRYKTTRYATLINQALKMAKGKYISYSTDDTVYLPNRLEDMISFFKNNPSAQIVYSSQLIKKVDVNQRVIHQFTRQANEVLQEATFKVDHCSVMHNRCLLKKIYQKYKNYWDDHKNHWNHADGLFWKRLNEIDVFYPINKILDITYKTPISFQNLYKELPNEFIDGTIIKGTTNDLYFVSKNYRKKLEKDLFDYYKYKEKHIITVPDPILLQFPESAPIDFSENIPDYLLIMEIEAQTYYYLENGKKREIKDLCILHQLKFNRHEAVFLEGKLLMQFPNGIPLYKIIDPRFIPPSRKVIRSNNKYFIFLSGKMREVDRKVLERLHLLKESFYCPPYILKKFPRGDKISSLT